MPVAWKEFWRHEDQKNVFLLPNCKLWRSEYQAAFLAEKSDCYFNLFYMHNWILTMVPNQLQPWWPKLPPQAPLLAHCNLKSLGALWSRSNWRNSVRSPFSALPWTSPNKWYKCTVTVTTVTKKLFGEKMHKSKPILDTASAWFVHPFLRTRPLPRAYGWQWETPSNMIQLPHPHLTCQIATAQEFARVLKWPLEASITIPSAGQSSRCNHWRWHSLLESGASFTKINWAIEIPLSHLIIPVGWNRFPYYRLSLVIIIPSKLGSFR